MSDSFFGNPEAVLGTLARLFAAEGAAIEVAVLTYSAPEIVQTGYDNWNGGIYLYTLFLRIPLHLYSQIQDDVESIEKVIRGKAQVFLVSSDNDVLSEVKIVPAVVDDPQWREKASAWLSGSKVNNQGRVRSDNVAPLSVDGLLFRSNPEINLYRAMKAAGVSFAPLPVFVRGGEKYSRIEPDFVVIHGGVTVVVEVDGDTVHHETPAEAHARTTMLAHEGVHIERLLASQCDTPEKAKNAAAGIVAVIKKLQSLK